MPKKFDDFEIPDKALSRRLWRKAISTDDSTKESEIQKYLFENYQRHKAEEEITPENFPACVKNSKLRKALLTLTAKQRKVIELYYFHNMTQTDIAESLSCSQVAVSKLLCRAVEKIQRLM